MVRRRKIQKRDDENCNYKKTVTDCLLIRSYLEHVKGSWYLPRLLPTRRGKEVGIEVRVL